MSTEYQRRNLTPTSPPVVGLVACEELVTNDSVSGIMIQFGLLNSAPSQDHRMKTRLKGKGKENLLSQATLWLIT